MQVVRCYAGQFFGGYPSEVGSKKTSVKLSGVKLILDNTAADTATELELEDWGALNERIETGNRAYQASKVNRLFHHKASADDSNHFFELPSPLWCHEGIKIRTNTNCRVALYVE